MAGFRKMGNRYYSRLRLNGREKLIPLNTSNLTEAKRRHKLVEEKEWMIKAKLATEEELFKVPPPSLSEAIDGFFKSCRNRRLAEKTLRSYTTALDLFMSIVGPTIKVDNLNKDHYDRFLAKTEEKGYAVASVNSYQKSLKTFFNWLVEEGKLDKPPFKIAMLRVEKKLPEFLMPTEVKTLFSHVEDPKMLATFRVYQQTGIRLREMHNCEIDQSSGGVFIKIRKAKGKKERMVPIPPEVVEDFKVAMYAPWRHNPEISGPYNPDFISKTFSRCRNEVGIAENKSLHSLRHSFALVKLLEWGNIYLVKEALGHSSVSVTEIYLQFPQDYLRTVFREWIPEVEKMKATKVGALATA